MCAVVVRFYCHLFDQTENEIMTQIVLSYNCSRVFKVSHSPENHERAHADGVHRHHRNEVLVSSLLLTHVEFGFVQSIMFFPENVFNYPMNGP